MKCYVLVRCIGYFETLTQEGDGFKTVKNYILDKKVEMCGELIGYRLIDDSDRIEIGVDGRMVCDQVVTAKEYEFMEERGWDKHEEGKWLLLVCGDYVLKWWSKGVYRLNWIVDNEEEMIEELLGDSGQGN